MALLRTCVRDLLYRYELMRSKMIKHNKDVFEVLGDNFAALEKLHIY